jgi:hypothetical protein
VLQQNVVALKRLSVCFASVAPVVIACGRPAIVLPVVADGNGENVSAVVACDFVTAPHFEGELVQA